MESSASRRPSPPPLVLRIRRRRRVLGRRWRRRRRRRVRRGLSPCMQNLVVIAPLLFGVLLLVTGVLGATGRLPKNDWVGLAPARRHAGRRDLAQGHKAGGPWLVAGGIIDTVGGLRSGSSDRRGRGLSGRRAAPRGRRCRLHDRRVARAGRRPPPLTRPRTSSSVLLVAAGEAAAAVLLHVVHGAVGGEQQAALIAPIAGVDGDADAGRAGDLVPVDVERAAQLRERRAPRRPPPLLAARCPAAADMNSSPPKRASVSPSRRTVLRRRARRRKKRSPPWCPSSSLIALKLSQSTNSTASTSSLRCAWARAMANRSLNSLRLGSPVSSSCRASSWIARRAAATSASVRRISRSRAAA